MINEDEIRSKRVLEVGSCDVNGSYRYFVEQLKPKEYIGIDIVKGPGVDYICPVEDLVKRFGENYFDLVISTCTLEHVRDWKSAISNIKRVCKENGVIIVIAPSVWPVHEFPYDYWRYRVKDMINIFSDCRIVTIKEIARTPYLVSIFLPRTANVYAKIRKPLRFNENDLSKYRLYSIVKGEKVMHIPAEYCIESKKGYFQIIRTLRRIIISFLYKLQKIYLRSIYVGMLLNKHKGHLR